MYVKDAIQCLKKLKARRVLIQFGEGLKLRVQELAKQLEKAGMEPVLCLEPCYGACDVRDVEAKRLGCDAILHVGHEKLVESELPVVYWEYFLDLDPLPILRENLKKLEAYQRIGLVTSIQFVKLLGRIKEFLKGVGKEVYTSKALQYEGQVLGCDLRAAKAIEANVDCFLCVSAGKFYAIGIMWCTEKPVLNLDVERGTIEELKELKLKLQHLIAWNLRQFQEAKRVGVLLSWKPGQLYKGFELKKRIERMGKEVYLLAMDEVVPEKIEGLKLDALINCACPRIGIDELECFKLPLINASLLNTIFAEHSHGQKAVGNSAESVGRCEEAEVKLGAVQHRRGFGS